MKSRSHFQFRQFSVADDQCSMKVGTDAVLLAAWAPLQGARRVLDIGTGSGVIALMAAQRTPDECLITGIDIQEADQVQAASNAAASPWSARIEIVHGSIDGYTPPYQFDAILCNPPYFMNSLLPPAEGRTTARHTISLTHEMLVAAVDRLLTPSGTASFVLPPDEANLLAEKMHTAGLTVVQSSNFRTRAEKKVERVLLSFQRTEAIQKNTPSQQADPTAWKAMAAAEILLYGTDDQWTQGYADLTQDFYLPGRKRGSNT